MARTNWPVAVLNSALTFTSDGNLSAPNENLSIDIQATQQRVLLADGSAAYITPENTYLNEPLQFRWLADDGTIKDKIEGYIENDEFLRITDHNGVHYYGKFTSVKRVWLTGIAPDSYDLDCTFEQMDPP